MFDDEFKFFGFEKKQQQSGFIQPIHTTKEALKNSMHLNSSK